MGAICVHVKFAGLCDRQCGAGPRLTLPRGVPMLSGAAGIDLGGLAGQLVGGGVSGAIVSAIVGMVVNNMRKA